MVRDNPLEDPDNRDFKNDLEQALQARSDKLARNVADRITELAVDNINEKGIANTGNLAMTAKVLEIETGKYKAVVDADYAGFVEFGTIPHMPPIEPIKEWVKLKLDADNVEETAWKVAKKIEKEGTSPQPFFRPAIEQVKGEIPQLAREVWRKE